MYSIKYYFYTKTKILGAGRLLPHPLQAVFFLVLVLTFQEYFDLFSDSLISRIPEDQSVVSIEASSLLYSKPSNFYLWYRVLCSNNHSKCYYFQCC